MKFFKKLRKNHPHLYVIYIGIAVVMFWRGTWGLLDMFLFPGNELASYILSAGIGLLLLFINDYKLTELNER